MSLDLRWLSAPEAEVAAAMAGIRRDSRPGWVPTKRQVLVHVNHCLLLWYLCIAFMTIGIRVDGMQDGTASPSDFRDLGIAVAILAVWLCGTFWLYRWAAKPPSPRARIAQWRQTLTALANGLHPQPSSVATFPSLISHARRGVREYPRFVAPNLEFGNLTQQASRATHWHYLALRLPAPLPHLILDSTANNGAVSDLPGTVARNQRLSLEGDFDRWFHLYTPAEYERDALYLFTPDVMAAFIDDAAGYNVEIIDDTLVFFTSPAADFTTAQPWESVYAIVTGVAPRVARRALYYRDERAPHSAGHHASASARTGGQTVMEASDESWMHQQPAIGPDGRRLQIRNRHTSPVWSALGAVGWFLTLTLLYAVPGIFAFAGLMSIIDGW
ncbi:hypothetical protein [Microbacterium jiangjiandongii]|uniref:hypothetical protein n=1 Tax=Microbacterium jiangjiandongii TaxID=3049071 RepID=UPI00214BD637|nr:hypothetical protein [Microbacterium sp. zg.Y843]MCR2814456.1 hypothetical protein [Microbacterium sp. zg.Y843]